MKLIYLIFLSLSLTASYSIASNNLLDDTSSNQQSSLNLESDTFLPVEEAYQLSVDINNNKLTLNWVIADGYYLYGEQFKVSIDGQPLATQREPGIIQYDPIFEKNVEKYYSFVQLFAELATLPEQPFELSVTSQGCADAGLCYPPNTQRFTISNNVATPITTTPPPKITPTPLPSANTQWTTTLWMIFLALIGGMILNLMPCVLPVLSLKALSLANSQSQHRRQGWAYTLGTVTTFASVAALLLVVRAAGQAVGWGFQLQSPAFITLLTLLFFVMGLSLSGYLVFGGRWMGIGQQLTQGEGTTQSYFTGVLAAIVASPCTAPFMATALGYAITQPWWLALSIFISLGFGMALPLLLLSYLPQLERWLPKPGPWMDTFKQALAFPLYLTAIWLLWVLGRQQGADTVTLVCLAALLIVFIIWLGRQFPKLLPLSGLTMLIIVGSISWHNSKQTVKPKTAVAGVYWESYSRERLDDLRRNNQSAFINMTADWCITCLANEKLVFTEVTLQSLKDAGVVLLKGDWTNYDPEITRLLEEYNRGGVPLYLLFPANGDAIVLPQLLTPGKFQQALAQIR